MHVQEQRAWFTLIVMLSAFLLYDIVVAFVGFHPAAFGVFGIMGFCGFAGLIGSRKKKQGLLVMDERDREISRLSLLSALALFWCLFILGAVAPLFILGPDTTITVKVSEINAIAFPIMCFVFLVQALTTIILYRRGGDAQ